MSDTVTTHHQPMEAVRVDDRPWEILRWPGQWSKMLFHPRPDRATEPNAGLVRYEPGSHHPLHKHDFAQVWYILEGQFQIGENTYGPGTMLFYPDPHWEAPLSTSTGGLMLRAVPGADDREPPDLRRPLQHDGAQAHRRGEPRALSAGVRTCFIRTHKLCHRAACPGLGIARVSDNDHDTPDRVDT